jgi:hypothetical protein
VKRTIKLMAEYGGTILWACPPDDVGSIDIESLPLSAALKSDLQDWAERYDQTLDDSDPMASGFATLEAEQAFEQDGRRLLEALRAELGTDFEVVG